MNAFVDDMCIVESVKYNCIPRLNEYVNDINKWMSANKMCLNPKKSNVVIMDKSKGKCLVVLMLLLMGKASDTENKCL